VLMFAPRPRLDPHRRGENTGETQRILPHAVSQVMTTTSSGALVALTEGSTDPVTAVVHHGAESTTPRLITIGPR
jgi:hypothetical protein